MFLFFLIILCFVSENISSFVCFCCVLCLSLSVHLSSFSLCVEKEILCLSKTSFVYYLRIKSRELFDILQKRANMNTVRALSLFSLRPSCFYCYDLSATFILNFSQILGFHLWIQLSLFVTILWTTFITNKLFF
jgi:hypothetical protein